MRLLVFSLLFFISSSVLAQADLWRTEDGLSNDWISDINQDKQGYLWLATQYGLNRFDGYDFDSYNYTPDSASSLSANWVRHLEVSDEGMIFFSCFFGQLHRYDPIDDEFVKLHSAQDSVYPSVVRDILIDSADNLWVGATNGLFLLPSRSTELKRLYDLSVNDIEMSSDGSLFLVAHDAIYRINDTHINPRFEFTDQLTFKQLFIDNQDNLWAINDQGLWSVDQSTWSFNAYPLEDFGSSGVFHATSILEDNKGRLWVAGDKGVNIIRANRSEQDYMLWDDLIKEDINPVEITKIFQDRDDNIWIGTNKGLVMTSSLHRRFLSTSDFSTVESIKRVRHIHVHDDIVWLGNEEGLYEVRPGSQAIRMFKRPVQSIYYGSDKTLYIGSGSDIFRKVDGEEVFQKFINDDYAGGITWEIIEDQEGYIWFASLEGLSRYDPRKQSFIKWTSSNHPDINSEISQGLILDKDGMLWGGSLRGGVYQLSNTYDITDVASAKFINYSHKINDSQSLSSNLITSMTSGPDGSIWVGTDGGLNRISENGEVKHYLKSDQLHDDKFMSLHIDDDNTLWGSTIGHGIMAMNLNTEEVMYFDKEDGLTSNNFLLNSGFLTQDGTFYMGSDSKTQVVNTKEALSTPRVKTDFLFTDIAFLSSDILQEINTDQDVRIPYGNNSFEVSFSTLQYFKADKTKYEYRILPTQTIWQTNGSSRSIKFNELSEGNYTLEVGASNSLLHIEPDIIRLHIRVSPPWWRTWWAYLIYALLGIALIYYLIKRREEKAEAIKLQELNELKTKLYTNITHEIRTPLTVILGLSKKLMDNSIKSIASSSEVINRNGNHLLLLVNRILDLSKIESGKMPIAMARKDLVGYITYLLESFHSWADEKDIRIHFLPKVDNLLVDIDPEITKQIINNLLSNAIKYTPIGGDIYCQLDADEHTYTLNIGDTGPGIEGHILPRLFDRFYQHEAKQNSSGIGLAVTKELTELLNGKITVENNMSKGATFTVVFPMSKKAPFQEDTAIPTQPNNINQLTDNLYQVLIIEDNQDVQQYVHDILKGRFRISLASNGKMGFELASEIIPDLVICDVMMPGLSGFEVCKKLKTTLATNHIPVILLTAKADQESKLEGLQHGADDYLIKPFDAEELELKINNLLTSRHVLHEKYKKGILDGAIDTTDNLDPFVQQVIDLIDSRLSDSEFGIARVCRELGISRVHLHRKLKALTNQSTSIFIRNVRLSRSRQMLLETDKNVSEVAYDVGFTDPSYFSKLYSEKYGLPPSQEK